MLSRTADNLYWFARYVERAENLARILDGTARMAALPHSIAQGINAWEGALQTAGVRDAFNEHYEDVTRDSVVDFLAFSDKNPSSIRSCFEHARDNARAVRTAITSEMWDAINVAWLDMRSVNSSQMSGQDLARFLQWAKRSSLEVDGSAYRTMLRNDGYYFTRLGTFTERADNTARILDVKYHVLMPDEHSVGGGVDYYQWGAILRSVSALTSYHWVYRENLKPWLIAELLILRPEMPRSLMACYENIATHLENLADDYGRQGKSQRFARSIYAGLQSKTIDAIFQDGLHQFLAGFIADNNRLGGAIFEQYLS
ncbi:MAG: alpha-E domain-containing protein [Pseudomonadota bacterium]